MANKGLRIGVDVGGTKIEALAIAAGGAELLRYRVPTPRGDYNATVGSVSALVSRLEQELATHATVGVGIPGTIARETGLVKNANSVWLNGRPFDRDLAKALSRPVRCANDANCLAVSEASDGAAAGKAVVFAVILGTGCGGGIARNGRVHAGSNGVAGEWGHNPLPWPRPEEYPGPACYCGRNGCIETWISGTGLAQDHERVNNIMMTGEEILAASEGGNAAAMATMTRHEERVARALAHVVNMLDPDVIVVGGGLSRIQRLYANLPALLPSLVFGGSCNTPVVQAKHGDSSGVRGAAWLWSVEEAVEV
ncbi:MAG TPA: fructokinase [Acidobacteriaceae bacterium]|nr:fructokinase [Acidobacteriaceae bacterium]